VQEHVAKKSLFLIPFLSPRQNVSHFNALVCCDVIQEMSLSFCCSTFSTACGDKSWYTLLTSEFLKCFKQKYFLSAETIAWLGASNKAEEHKEVAKILLSMKRT